MNHIMKLMYTAECKTNYTTSIPKPPHSAALPHCTVTESKISLHILILAN